MRPSQGANPIQDLSRCLNMIHRGRSFRRQLMNQTPDTLGEWSRPLLDAVTLFERISIGYALVGGVAAMVYGRARFTEDLDFVASPDCEQTLASNAQAMRDCGFDPACTWKLYHSSGVEMDLWKDEHAAEIVAQARTVILAGREVRVAEPHDLIAMKLRADRTQDDYDISEILKQTPIDDGEVRRRVSIGQFDHYLSIKKRLKRQ